MKKILFLLLFPLTLLAQKKEAVYQKLANATCDCSNQKGENISQSELGICIFESLNTLSKKERKTIGYNTDDKMAKIEDIAKHVGIEMALVCPKIFSAIKKENYQENATEVVDAEEVETAETAVVVDSVAAVTDSYYSDLSVTGKVEIITSGQFKTIQIIDQNKVKHNFIWLFPFEGDRLFIKNKIVKGDKLEISYVEQEFFNPKLNAYKTYKEIRSIKLL